MKSKTGLEVVTRVTRMSVSPCAPNKNKHKLLKRKADYHVDWNRECERDHDHDRDQRDHRDRERGHHHHRHHRSGSSSRMSSEPPKPPQLHHHLQLQTANRWPVFSPA
ncbi:E3 ubiquitin ligase PQT3-like isoform X1 [Arachis ipaensis]|nr:E3 ubiquitin ligase PQT3-like isoform X1 [Arachis ipaensis]